MKKKGDLFSYIIKRSIFSETELNILILPLLKAVQYIHALGIVHGDIKPENILFDPDNPSELKLTDFGLSKIILSDNKLTNKCGTLSYVAPEVLLYQGYDMKADMWSIGVIMYLLFYGKMPFDSEKEKDIYNNILIKELSIENTLISGLLKKNPIDRLNSEDSIKLISYLDF